MTPTTPFELTATVGVSGGAAVAVRSLRVGFGSPPSVEVERTNPVDGAGESIVGPDHVELSGARVDGGRGQALAGAEGCAGVRVGVGHELLGRDGRRPRPGGAPVGGRAKPTLKPRGVNLGEPVVWNCSKKSYRTPVV